MQQRNSERREKTKITINGKEYYAKHVTIKDGYIFIDGRYVSPGSIESITLSDD